MDFYTHILSGVSAGTLAASIQKKPTWQTPGVIVASAVGSIVPDIDALSSSRNFDPIVNSLFNMNESGKDIYMGTHWFSHHYFFHSFLGGICITVAAILLIYSLSIPFLKNKSILEFVKKRKVIFFAFLIGFLIHLAGDFLTPGGMTGGIRLLWPKETLFGGIGWIWSTHNYDLIIIFITCIIINILLILFSRKKTLFKSVVVFVMMVILVIIQIDRRNCRYTSFTHADVIKGEKESMDFQKRVLGSSIFSAMKTVEQRLSSFQSQTMDIP